MDQPPDGLGLIKSFRAKDIGFFDPNHIGLFIETKDSDDVCRNVFVFTKQLRAKAVIFDPAVLRQNIEQCRHGKVLIQHIYELEPIARLELCLSPHGVDAWYEALENRFCPNAGDALIELERMRYTVDNVRH